MSEKLKDQHGRWRNVTVAFRISPEESDLLNSLVSMSGLTKQEYITSKLCDRSVAVIPNSRVQRALAQESRAIYQELTRIRDASAISPELEARICLLSDTFAALGIGEPTESEVAKNDASIRMLTRSGGGKKPETGHTDQSTASSPTAGNYKPRTTRRGNDGA